MAQVKKFQSGGKVQGKFIKDGKEIIADEKFISQFTDYVKSMPDGEQIYGQNIIDSLNKGETVTYDSLSSELSGVNYDDKLRNSGKKKSKRYGTAVGEGIDRVLNNSTHRLGEFVRKLKGFDYVAPIEKEVIKERNKFDLSNNLTIDYNETDGKKTYSNNPHNTSILNRIQGLIDHYDNNVDQDVLGIDVDNVGSFHKSNNTRFSEITDRIKSGSLNEEDLDILKSINISVGNKPTSNQQQTIQTQTTSTQQPTPSATNTNSPTESNDVILTENGITITDDGIKIEGWDESRGIGILNDWSGIDINSPYYGGVVYGNKYYTKEEALADQNITNILNGFKSAALNNDIATLSNQQQVNYFWGNQNPFMNYNKDDENFDVFHESLSQLNNPVISYLNSAYNFGNNSHGIAYYDSTSERDELTGMPIDLKYQVYDANNKNNPYAIYNSSKDFTDRSYSQESRDVQVPINGYVEFKGNKYAKVQDINGYGIFRNQRDKNLYIERNGDFFLITNYDTYNKLRNGEEVSTEELENMYEGNKMMTNNQDETLYRSPHWDNFISHFNPSAPKNNIAIRADVSNLSELLNSIRANRSQQLGALKYQSGGVLSKVKSSTKGGSDKISIEGLRDLNKSATKSDFDKNGTEALSDADWIQLGAIGADLAGTGMSFIPGLNMAAAATGIGATTAQLVSDIKRDGFQTSDATNAAMGYGLDALTFIPGVGAASKASKAVRTIKSGAQALGKGFALYGIANASSSLNNIVNGDYTLDDVRNVATGIQSMVGLGRSVKRTADDYQLRKDVKKGQSTDVSLKSNEIDADGKPIYKDITLTKQEIDAIRGKGGKTNKADVEKLLEKKIKKNGETISEEHKGNLSEIMGLEATNPSVTRSGWLFRNKTSDDRVILPETKKSGSSFIDALMNRDFDLTNYNPRISSSQDGLKNDLITSSIQRGYDRRVNETPWLFGDKFFTGNTRTNWWNGNPIKIYSKNANKPTNNINDQQAIELDPQFWYKKGGILKFQNSGKIPSFLTNLKSSILGNIPTYTVDDTVIRPKNNIPTYTVDDTVISASKNSNTGNSNTTNGIFNSIQPKLESKVTPLNFNTPTDTKSSIIPNLSGKITPLNFNTKGYTPVEDTLEQTYKGNLRNKFNIKADPRYAMELAKYTMAKNANNKQHGVIDNAYDEMMRRSPSQLNETYNTFSDSTILSNYQNAADKTRGTKFVTSDPALMAAQMIGNANLANQIELEGKNKFSSAYSQHKNNNAELRRRYDQANHSINESWRKELQGYTFGKANNEASRIGTNFRSTANLTSWLSDALNNNININNNIGDLNRQKQYGDDFNNVMKNYENKYNNLLDSNGQINGVKYQNWHEWIQNDPTNYAALSNEINNLRDQSTINSLLSRKMSPFSISSLKKGGSINDDRMKNANDRHFKLSKQLNSDVIKLIMKAISK